MPGSATADLRSAPGAVALERDVVVVRGPDAVAFLQGQLSQDVEALAVGASAPTFLLQPTGKVDAWMRVTRRADDELLLDVDAGWGEAVRARLKRFLLRTKAELEPARWTGFALRGPGVVAEGLVAPAGGAVLVAAWPGVDGVDVLGPEGVDPAALPLPTVEAAALSALRVESGVPAMGAEADDGTIPAELGQWLVDASVSFTKGCYTGQELVARIDSRGGNVPRPLRGLVGEAPLPAGAVVRLDGEVVGRTTSAATSADLGPVALALLARAVEPGAAVTVATVDGGSVPARVAGLPLR